MEILTFLATIATVLSGLALLYKFFEWVLKKCIASRSTKVEKKSINISLDKNFNLLMADSDFQKVVQNLLFYSRSNEEIEFSISISELDKDRKKYSTLTKKGDLTEEELKNRNNLQIYFDYIDKRIVLLIKVLTALLNHGLKIYSHAFGDEDWKKIIKGIIENISQIGMGTSGAKIDVWRKEPYGFSAPIYVSEDELNSILEKFMLSDSQQFVGPMGYSAGELPKEINVSKVIPSISVAIACKVSESEVNEEEALSCYNLYGWNVGLG